MKKLDIAALEAAILGGLVLSAGASGASAAERHRKIGEAALELGQVELLPLERFHDDEALLVSTVIGAPGVSRPSTEPADTVHAARALVQASRCDAKAVIPGHVPGLHAWVIAAALGIPLADAAANGRAHPSVTMGGMGMSWESAWAPGLRVLIHGEVRKASALMRAAAVQNGGLICAVRGPFPAGLVRTNGAPGSISFALGLGQALLSAPGAARVKAAVDYLGGEVIVSGEVLWNTVEYRDGCDTGTIRVGDVTLGVYNQLMTAERGGKRVATFPDFLASLDPQTGEPLAVSALTAGTRVAIVATSMRNIPLGAGVFDPALYPEVEAAMGVDLASYALKKRTSG